MRNASDQPLQLRFDKGQDQSFGTRGGAPPGTFTVVQNCRLKRGGLEKRCGSTAITGETFNVSASHSVSDSSSDPRPTEHAAFIGRIGNQKVAGTSAGVAFGRTSAWLVQGGFSAAQPVRSRLGIAPTLATRPVGPYAPGVAVNSAGYICTAAGFGPELRITVESPTGELAYERSTVVGAAGVVVRVVCVGSTFYVLWQGSASTTVSYRALTLFGGGILEGGTASLVTLANAASNWDASSYDGTNWFIVYQSAATTVTLAKMAGVTAVTVTFSSTNNLTYLSVWADPVTARVWVGTVNDPAGAPVAAFRVYTTAPALSLGPTTVHSTFTQKGPPLFGPLYTRSPAAGDAFCVLCIERADLGAGTSPLAILTARIVGGSVESTQIRSWQCVPISKPDAQHRVWAITYAPGSNFLLAQVALLRFADADQVASVGGPGPLVDLASPPFETPGSVYHPAAALHRAFHAVAVTTESAGGSTFFALPFVLNSRTNASGATEPTTRVDVYEYTRWNQEPHRQMAPAGRTAIVSGQPTELWGVQTQINGSPFTTGAVEIGYLHAPIILSATATPNASGATAGTRLYYAVQQWIDDEGNRHLSPPSAPFTLTTAVPSSVVLNIAGNYTGQRLSPDRDIEVSEPVTLVFRTQDGGTEAQLVPIATTQPGPNWFGYVTATDTVADTIIDDNEFIYTAGGVLANVLAPSCRYLAVSEERLWCGGLWRSDIIECSKVRVPGEPYCFTGDDSHRVVIPGEVSGLAYMDGQVAVFTEDAVYLVAGDGPNDQGAGGFAPPRALVRGVGCPREQSASILETEIGILFRSKMGIYLIPRGYGSPEYIGEKVQDEPELVLSAATTTTTEHRLARFLVCAAGETKSARVLTLDLASKQWFRDAYNVNGSVSGQGFSEIGEWPYGLALMSYGLDRADNVNVVWAEDEDETADAGAAGAGASTYISQSVQTAWMDPFGPLGWGRLTRVLVSMEAVGSSSLVTLAIETDANAAQSPSWTITTGESVSYRAASVKEPTCTAFRLTISDAAGVTGSAGVRFLGLGLEVQPVGGLRAVPDSEAA